MDDVLFVIDPNLGPRARRLIGDTFRSAEMIVWARGDKTAAAKLAAMLEAKRHAVVLSFYSDYIFPEWALRCIELPLNIHPALPALPGVGYDWVPLWEAHRTHGATLHRMDAQIDAGEIYDVIERDLPNGVSHAELRARNQEVSLEMLARWLPVITAASDTDALAVALRDSAGALGNPGWTGDYCSRRDLARLRERNRSEPAMRFS